MRETPASSATSLMRAPPRVRLGDCFASSAASTGRSSGWRKGLDFWRERTFFVSTVGG
jgi:hypothetical protein